jgi:N-acetylmuramoyl-L-alanine amidase
VVAKDGRVFQMVEERKLAHHAGASQFQGKEDFNDFSIGIEIVNLNDGQDPYPADQFEATVELVSYLVEEYEIERQWIVTHADISTAGKTDPRGFPTHELISRVYDPAANLPEDVVREAAWNAAGIPFNPQAAFPRYAREHDLGVPQTDEFDFSYKGVNYRGQGFAEAIVFAQVGDWGNIKEMSW